VVIDAIVRGEISRNWIIVRPDPLEGKTGPPGSLLDFEASLLEGEIGSTLCWILRPHLLAGKNKGSSVCCIALEERCLAVAKQT
jgi:hypothetical protein